ncbi:MAG: DNA damage-inducible protein D [Candidatus Pacebacteria bacterium CG_4_10_14_3_um_filter_34_15]|nr:DNA damage-inducible protein D [Candidatus Paceibacterota bacterium]NCS86397.1 DNA damage-inducible protein D [Candidatus Paceibacterota bacterium]OIO44624.1 MAG: DNA damage-inducible protein D [Candidatus Pacebacteria bacterium CG1_02_43_31]PIX81903.1 MAG: DNA damage-inducible protein D [Candidatus Pacebacteria bacterium CG_4_10_14_3_um_filter_34_15]
MSNKAITIFEQIKKINEHQSEYWSARELAKILEYSEYRHFIPVINRAKESCKNAGQSIKNHIEEILEMVEIGSNTSRQIKDFSLSRYACYLIMQNADPSKEVVALGQTYFAIQTRKQEVQDQLVEDQKRVYLREEVTAHNKHLAQTASQAGVKNYGVFTNYGYMGLYGGLKSKEIAKKKKLKKSQKILDHMGSEELAANLFRATQADAKLKRENIMGEAKANYAHFEVGKKVRQTIKELGGTMPENLLASENISKSKTRLKKVERKELDD